MLLGGLDNWDSKNHKEMEGQRRQERDTATKEAKPTATAEWMRWRLTTMKNSSGAEDQKTRVDKKDGEEQIGSLFLYYIKHDAAC